MAARRYEISLRPLTTKNTYKTLNFKEIVDITWPRGDTKFLFEC